MAHFVGGKSVDTVARGRAWTLVRSEPTQRWSSRGHAAIVCMSVTKVNGPTSERVLIHKRQQERSKGTL